MIIICNMMLSRVSRAMLRRAFSTTSIQTQSTSMAETLHVDTIVPEDKQAILSASELRDIIAYSKDEKQHLASFINDLKSVVRDEIDINFSEPVENETVILQTEVGENNFRVAELLTVGALAKFCQLVMGFPSYGAMIGSLGLAGVGAVLSVSNHLRRSHPQITSVHITNDKKLHVYYLTPGIFMRNRKDLLTEASNFGFASFGCEVKNWLYKTNDTTWMKIDGQLYWLNSGSLQINSHLYHELF